MIPGIIKSSVHRKVKSPLKKVAFMILPYSLKDLPSINSKNTQLIPTTIVENINKSNKTPKKPKLVPICSNIKLIRL